MMTATEGPLNFYLEKPKGSRERHGSESHFYSTSYKIQQSLIAHVGLCSVVRATLKYILLKKVR